VAFHGSVFTLDSERYESRAFKIYRQEMLAVTFLLNVIEFQYKFI
jgi:hypothetical protein